MVVGWLLSGIGNAAELRVADVVCVDRQWAIWVPGWVWSEAMVTGRGTRAHGTALRQRRCTPNRCNTRERGTCVVGEAADVMANSERQMESGAIIVPPERGSSCGMYDRKNEHGVNVHIPGGAGGGLRC